MIFANFYNVISILYLLFTMVNFYYMAIVCYYKISCFGFQYQIAAIKHSLMDTDLDIVLVCDHCSKFFST